MNKELLTYASSQKKRKKEKKKEKKEVLTYALKAKMELKASIRFW